MLHPLHCLDRWRPAIRLRRVRSHHRELVRTRDPLGSVQGDAPPRREPITAANVESLEDYFREFANTNYWMRRNSSGANLGDRITPNDLEDYNIGNDEVMSVAWNRFVMTTH